MLLKYKNLQKDSIQIVEDTIIVIDKRQNPNNKIIQSKKLEAVEKIKKDFNFLPANPQEFYFDKTMEIVNNNEEKDAINDNHENEKNEQEELEEIENEYEEKMKMKILMR